MMEGTRKENLCNRSFGWINRQNNEVKPWLWKISDCFSAVEQTLPFSTKSKDFMENQKSAVELKAIPPPSHLTSARLFPATVLHSDHSSFQYSQTPLQPGLKVSSCAQCPSESSGIIQVHHKHGGGSIQPDISLDSQGAGTVTCQVGSGFPSLRSSPAVSSFVGTSINFPSDHLESATPAYQLQATFPPPSPHHLPCCGNLLKPLSPCHTGVHKLHRIPLHQSCTSSSCVSCTQFTGRAPGHLEEHFNSPERTPHLRTNSLNLNSDQHLCLKRTPCCDCLNKTPRKNLFETTKVWPNIPPPSSDHTASLTVSACDGCGNNVSVPPAHQLTAVNKTWQNCGSVDTSVAGQLQENLPPIGVFWDIENCSVPSGRSAVAVVQRIREKFFHGHREAEFICVCDISKENKEVIQELNNCQVTVAHINATAKNAADDKLRQSLRRFADTHTAPATVVLVSTDVNFASELSDLRHRHGFSIILIHKTQASEALLHHAHNLIPFEDFVTDLPPRLPIKSQDANTPRSIDSPVEKSSEDAVFQISNSSAFSKMTSSRHASPLHNNQNFWSPRSGSPNPSSRSSPLNGNVENLDNCTESSLAPFVNGVEVQVSNLDYRMSRKELQQLLQDIFSRHGKVKNVDLSPHTDYQLKAVVHMENIQEAVCGVSSLHRYKIGSKRIHVCLASAANDKSLISLSSEVTSILQDAPACCLPLFKLTEIYEKKFGHKLTVSDLYKLSDTVTVRDQGNSRMVCLLPSSKSRQSPLGSSQSHDGSSANCSPVIFEELEYHEPFCKLHSTNKPYSENEFDPDTYTVPFVVLSIKTFSPQVHSLLQTHEGTVPLLSFLDCYSAEFTFLEEVQEGQGGVPLEHLITCVPGVNIVTAQNGIKVVKWIHNKPPPPNADPWLLRSKSPVGNPQLIQFSREVIDLLKNQPYCIMPLSKFIPTYHHHFAKQCRVSDYGYSKLMELLEAVPHVLQILGMGSKRLLTLTHRAQIKRFTQDLMKLLKSQASKQVIVKEFKLAYHWCFSRDWDVTEYGTCELFDLLSEIPDTTVCVSQQDGEVVISVPKKERTQEEIEHTKQFAKEVVDLLRHQPHFRMPFNKFIPSYHHHFGRQCKLSYYGFTKLMELFEAIPEVLQVLECGEEKILTLTETERTKALAAQFAKLLRSQKDNCLMMSDLLTEYNKTFGYILRLQDYDACSIPALLQKLCHVVKVVDTSSGKQIQLINRKSLRTLTAQLLVLLMSMDGVCVLTVEQLKKQYESTHNAALNPCEYGFLCLSELLKSLPYLVEVSFHDEGEEYVQLTKLYQFAKNVRALLHTYHYQQIFMHEFVSAYTKYTGEMPQPKEYGYNNMEELLGAIPQVVWIKGHGHKRILVLKNDMKARANSTSSSPAYVEDYGSDDLIHQEAPHTVINEKEETGGSRTLDLQHPGTPGTSQNDAELLCLTSSPVDLLCGPVPSSLPSPQLRPDPVVVESTDLIQFEENSLCVPGIAIPADEKIASSAIVETASSLNPIETAIPVTEFVGPATGVQDCKVNKEAVSESPVKKTPRNRVKLAARFSLAPVTRL
ncbi:meiosis regulator and mRNA stability factor 1 [Protopterus annectens]|uniref:meiosis regulator and mRNA stability factor 1 n=1 Tax=Protopterus annectens TaxID=7888 RepID=UPI001CF959F0|nr:meiosis regulator and mRNA stability factor 1 [Protopterus annectens]